MVTSMFSKLGLPKGREPVIVDWKRSALGKKKNGKLQRIRGDDFIVPLVKDVAKRNFYDKDINLRAVAKEGLVDCLVGCNSQIGPMALDIGKTVALASHLPIEVPGVSINRQCASGMTTAWFGWQSIVTGDKDIIFAGGAEMQTTLPIMADMNLIMPDNTIQTIPPNIGLSRHPYIIEKAKEYGQSMAGQIAGAELMGKIWNKKIGNSYEEFRLELDELSVASHMKAVKPIAKEMRDKEILPIAVPKIGENGKPIVTPTGENIEGQIEWADTDEAPRPKTTVERCQKLKGIVKRRKGYLTAGNSCPETDGGAIMILVAREFAEEHSMSIRGTIEVATSVGTDPILMLTGPIASTEIAMKRGNTSLDDMSFIEINEAFSTVVKASCHDLNLDWKDPRINQWGGAIAIGHPTGQTGTRLIGTTLHMLEETQKSYAYSTLCVGLGMGMGIIVKREGG